MNYFKVVFAEMRVSKFICFDNNKSSTYDVKQVLSAIKDQNTCSNITLFEITM